MTPAILALTAVAAISAVVHIRAESRGPRWHVYLCKPLTTAAIIGCAWLAPQPATDGYRALVLAGLVFSLAGDVFLMLPRDLFRAGLASFLVAHLLYVAAFSRAVGFFSEPSAALPVADLHAHREATSFRAESIDLVRPGQLALRDALSR